MSLLPHKVTLMSVSTSNTYMKLQNFRKLGKNAKLSKKRTLPINRQSLFPQWCPLIRDYTISSSKLHYYRKQTHKNYRVVAVTNILGKLFSSTFQKLTYNLTKKINISVTRGFPKKPTKPHRSIHRRCFVTKGVLKNFSKFIGKHLYRSLFFNKVAGSGLQIY